MIRPLLYNQRLQIGRIGAPVDYILMDDLERARDYKMYIFLDAFHNTENQKKEIMRLKKRGAQAVVWIYAPGFVGETLDVQGIKDLTGFSVNYIADSMAIEVELNEKGLSEFSISEESITYGTGRKAGPVFYGEDAEADILGTIKINGKPGLLRKEVNGLQSYYSAAPTVASAVLRGIAENAGVHVYTREDDSFYANKSYLAVHTNKAGERTIRFPQLTDVYDVYNDAVVAEQASEFTVSLPDSHTVFYFLGSEAEWQRSATKEKSQ